jgi:hypothetical protein
LEERYGHLPKFLHYFVVQNWFKKLFPIFTLEVRRLWEAEKPNLGVWEGWVEERRQGLICM